MPVALIERYRTTVIDFLKKGLTPREIASGVALGAFVGVLPFLGLHTVMALGLAYVLRLNMVIVFLGMNISNPFTFPFILFLSAQIGSFVLRGAPLDLRFRADMATVAHYAIPTLAGSVVLGAAVSAFCYAVTLQVAKRFRA